MSPSELFSTTTGSAAKSLNEKVIEKTKVILNNNGAKECLELAPPKAFQSKSTDGLCPV